MLGGRKLRYLFVARLLDRCGGRGRWFAGCRILGLLAFWPVGWKRSWAWGLFWCFGGSRCRLVVFTLVLSWQRLFLDRCWHVFSLNVWVCFEYHEMIMGGMIHFYFNYICSSILCSKGRRTRAMKTFTLCFRYSNNKHKKQVCPDRQRKWPWIDRNSFPLCVNLLF